MDETGLFWEHMPDRTYISKEEKKMPGFKAAKDGLWLLLGGNVDRGHRLNQCHVYHLEKLCELHNISKVTLLVCYDYSQRSG
jgi:hypothetical protein